MVRIGEALKRLNVQWVLESSKAANVACLAIFGHITFCSLSRLVRVQDWSAQDTMRKNIKIYFKFEWVVLATRAFYC